MKKDMPLVFPLLLLSVLALITGLWAGLLRMGWTLPALTAGLPQEHGALMVSGFLGTLIALERVVALRKPWMYAAPLTSGLGWLIALALPQTLFGPLLIVLGSLFTTAILLTMVRILPKIYIVTMAVGAACWLVGNILWVSGTPIFGVAGWWTAFLVLTVAGERLELSRVLRLTRRHFQLFSAAAAVFLLGAGLSTWLPEIGARVFGAGSIFLALWLVRYDLARRNLRNPAALTRFIAICLFSGYIWLGVSGVLNLLFGPQTGGVYYDAILHTVFVGFIFSMIFGHAPIIVPALTGLKVSFHKLLYLPLILLHASLLLRVIGDLSFWIQGRRWGGILNEIAVLAFLGIFAYILTRRDKVKELSAVMP